MTPRLALRLACVVMVALLVAPSGCRRDEGGDKEGPVSAAPKVNELSPLALRDDTPDLLLTYIDDKGDFHVVTKPGDVPAERRNQVRAVVTTREDGTRDLVYVADLTRKNADGSYPVATMTRGQWDELGAAKRKARLEKLAPLPPQASSSAGPSPSGAQPPGDSRIVAIIYGAEWCKPCHDAARYLKQRGVTVVEKDIDESAAAAAELKKKLEGSSMSGAKIPVIDIMGKLLVGYSPRALDRAIEAAKGSQTL
jgi:glutaredoxin